MSAATPRPLAELDEIGALMKATLDAIDAILAEWGQRAPLVDRVALRLPEAARALGASEQMVRRLIDAQELEEIRLATRGEVQGGDRRVLASSLFAYVKRQRDKERSEQERVRRVVGRKRAAAGRAG